MKYCTCETFVKDFNVYTDVIRKLDAHYLYRRLQIDLIQNVTDVSNQFHHAISSGEQVITQVTRQNLIFL